MKVWAICCTVFLLQACGSEDSSSRVDQQFAEDTSSFADNPDFLVQRGLLANKKHQYVDLLAYAGEIDVKSPLNVILSGRDSSSTAAVAIAEVNVNDLQRALEFIGLSAGHPIDVEQLLYWPKGNRVTISVSWDAVGDGRFDQVVNAEQLVIDTQWESTLPELGFRYVGPSMTVSAVDQIVATRNATNTLFEVAYTVGYAPGSDNFRLNPDYAFTAGQPLRVRIRSESQGDRVQDYQVLIEMGAGDDGGQLDNLITVLRASDSEKVLARNFSDLFVVLESRIADGEEPFLQFQFSDGLSAAAVKDVARFASQFLVEQQVRIEPFESQPYISAFLPNEQWRDPGRRQRSTQPIEIHLRDGLVAGELIRYLDEEPVRQPFGSDTALIEMLQTGGPWETDGVLVFVSPNTPFGQIRKVYDCVRTQFENFYVFL